MKKSLLLGTIYYLLALTNCLHAQSTSPITAHFIGKEYMITPGEILSNVLRIENTSSEPVLFNINLDFPYGWKQISRIKDGYTIAPGDSLFLPFRFIPSGDLTGNNRFMLSAFIVGQRGEALANDLFWAHTEKKTSWSMSTESGTKIYFKNDENRIRFDVNILNTGSERQPMVLNMNNMSLLGEVRDSANTRTLTQPVNFTLNPYQDTTFNFSYQLIQGERNQSRIDLENYRPTGINENRSFNLLVTSEEPDFGQPGAFQTGQRFQFRKLSDNTRADNNSFSHLPLIVDYNLSNLFDEVTFATLNLRGVAQLDATRQLIYNFQGSSTNNQYNQFLTNNNYYIGYFGSKGNVQLGYINGGFLGIQGFGQGVKSSLMINRSHQVTGYIVTRKDRFDQEALRSYGFAYDVKYFKQNKARFEIGQSDNKFTGVKTTALNSRVSINFLRTQSVNFSISNTWNQLNNLGPLPVNTFGYFGMTNYNGNFIRGKLAINHSVGYNTREYANSNIERLFYNHRTRLMFTDKWSATIVNNYNQSTTMIVGHIKTGSLTNQFMVNRSFKNKSVQPYVFANLFQQSIVTYQIRGAGVNFNQFNPKTNTRFSTTVEGGANLPTHIPNPETTTFLQWTALAFYKTVSLNARYLVGIYGYTPQLATQINTSNQQLFTSSLQHQYLFANRKVMIQTGFNYSFNNIFKQHNITLFPDIYYFTNDGWRFRLGFNYNILSGIALKNNYSTQQATADEAERLTTQNTFIAAGIRKEFALPVPFKKSTVHDMEFVAFFDINGNGIKDKSEKSIENIVIRIGDEEVISNAEGDAKINNMHGGLHRISAFSLDRFNGWFANIEDTVMVMKSGQYFVPFVRGVRIKGKINIDRDAINADADDPFDLGRIRVVASGNKVYSVLTDFNGSFELYVPYGKYTITMDEGILGSRYKLARNNYEVEATRESDGMIISFLIMEKRRKVIKKQFPTPETVNPAAPVTSPKPAAPRKR